MKATSIDHEVTKFNDCVHRSWSSPFANKCPIHIFFIFDYILKIYIQYLLLGYRISAAMLATCYISFTKSGLCEAFPRSRSRSSPPKEDLNVHSKEAFVYKLTKFILLVNFRSLLKGQEPRQVFTCSYRNQ